MVMKKPDRYERVVNDSAITIGGHSIYVTDAINLLRREHAWMQRTIRNNKLFGARNTDWKVGYTAALQWMLDQLTQRRK